MGMLVLTVCGVLSSSSCAEERASPPEDLLSEPAVLPLPQKNQKETLMKKDAVLVAEKTKEAEAFYNLQGGHFRNCIEKEVLRPCDSDWVTCIDHAWVVRFQLGKTCGIEHDGRLSLTFLIDAVTGQIISKFPEADYFQKETHCLIDADCLCVGSTDKAETASCLNFVYGQLSLSPSQGCGECRCQNNICQAKP